MPDSSGRHAAPVCLAIVMADFVWSDPSSRKKTILGTFNEIRPTHYPFMLPTLGVYTVYSGGRGRVHLTLRIVAAADANEEPLAVTSLDVDFPDPLAELETGALFQNVVFPDAGDYRVQARAFGQTLLERRLALLEPFQPTM